MKLAQARKILDDYLKLEPDDFYDFGQSAVGFIRDLGDALEEAFSYIDKKGKLEGI